MSDKGGRGLEDTVAVRTLRCEGAVGSEDVLFEVDWGGEVASVFLVSMLSPVVE